MISKFIIDASYKTNNLKMPLICFYDVSNIGGKTLKTYLIAFSWASNETKDTYSFLIWSLESRKRIIRSRKWIAGSRKRMTSCRNRIGTSLFVKYTKINPSQRFGSSPKMFDYMIEKYFLLCNLKDLHFIHFLFFFFFF